MRAFPLLSSKHLIVKKGVTILENSILGQTDFQKEKDDKMLCLYISIYHVFTALNISIKSIFQISDVFYSYLSNMVAVALLVGFILSIPVIFRRGRIIFLSVELFAFMAYFISFFMGNSFSTSFLLNKALWTMGICIPLGIAAYSIIDKHLLLYYLTISSWLIIFPLSVAMLNLNQNDHSYSMACAYALLLPVLIMYYNYFYEKRFIYLIVAVACTIIISFFGNRGAVLCIFGYIAIRSVLLNPNRLHKFLYISFFALASFFLVFWQDIVFSYLESIIRTFGIRSYTLSRILNASFYESNSRMILWNLYLDKIGEKPLLGWGVAGGWISPEYYPHNIFLELLLSFGVIVGSIIGVYFILNYLKTIMCKNIVYRELLLIYAMCSISIFISGSFLNTPKVFIFWLLSVGYRSFGNICFTFRKRR